MAEPPRPAERLDRSPGDVKKLGDHAHQHLVPACCHGVGFHGCPGVDSSSRFMDGKRWGSGVIGALVSATARFAGTLAKLLPRVHGRPRASGAFFFSRSTPHPPLARPDPVARLTSVRSRPMTSPARRPAWPPTRMPARLRGSRAPSSDMRCHRCGRGSRTHDDLAWVSMTPREEATFVGVGNVELAAVTEDRARPVPVPGVVGGRLRKVTEMRMALRAGDLLVLYTDGISTLRPPRAPRDGRGRRRADPRRFPREGAR